MGERLGASIEPPAPSAPPISREQQCATLQANAMAEHCGIELTEEEKQEYAIRRTMPCQKTCFFNQLNQPWGTFVDSSVLAITLQTLNPNDPRLNALIEAYPTVSHTLGLSA